MLAGAIGVASLTACSPPPKENQRPGTGERRLTAGEVEMAREIFGDQINYNRIFITRNNSDTTSRVMSGRMRMSRGAYADDYSRIQNPERISIYFHELVHIWQEQQGVSLVDSAVSLFFKHGGDYSKSYEYSNRDLLNYPNLSIEQQAEILQHYVYMRETLAPYNAEQNCGRLLELERAVKPTFPSIQTPGLCR